MSLHINAKYVLLTYAQCGTLEGDAIMERISSLGGECIVARESHSDGGVHLHVFVRFGRKFRSRKADVFDVDGRHPNIVPSRGTPEKGYDYAVKDGDIVCGGLRRGTASAEVEMGRLAISGLRLRVRRIENSFGNFVTSWIPRVLQQLSVNLEHTRTGNSLWPIQSINIPQGILSGLDSLTDEMIGYYNLESDLRNHA